ncbi:hypothetical protein MRX96_032169 [Rhipicephalus microplus]
MDRVRPSGFGMHGRPVQTRGVGSLEQGRALLPSIQSHAGSPVATAVQDAGQDLGAALRAQCSFHEPSNRYLRAQRGLAVCRRDLAPRRLAATRHHSAILTIGRKPRSLAPKGGGILDVARSSRRSARRRGRTPKSTPIFPHIYETTAAYTGHAVFLCRQRSTVLILGTRCAITLWPETISGFHPLNAFCSRLHRQPPFNTWSHWSCVRTYTGGS